MGIRRKSIAPPFEVMRRGLPPAAPVEEIDADLSPEPDQVASVKQPIVLRVPRGYAVLAGVAVVGLVMLSYWVGHARGRRAAIRELTPPVTDAADLAGAGARPTFDFSGATGVTAGESGGSGRAVAGDPRVPGLNYFLVAHYPPAEADKLVQFFAGHGVEAIAVPVQNKGLAQVFVVSRGFGANELYSEPYQRFERQLKLLGRQWKAQHRGADDLSGMYPALYARR